MDFTTLMNVASAKQKSKDKIKINRYSLDLPAPKKEVKEVVRSDVVKKLIQEKENEKQLKEKLQREKEKAREREERKKSQFRIPKKKPVENETAVDTEKLINSLFDDDEDDVSAPVSNGLDSSSRLSSSDGEHSPKCVSDSKSDNHKHSSSQKSSSSSSSSKAKEKSSHSSHESSKSSSHSSLSKDNKHHSSSSSSSHSKSSSSSRSKSSSSSHSKSSSSSSSHSKSSSSSSSKHGSGSHHSSSVSKHKSSSHSKSSSSSSKQSSSSSKSSSSLSLMPDSKPASTTSPSAAEQQPIALSKHHLKPVAERHAVPTAQLSEKEKILAKLAAIKQRTLDAIHKEQQGKGRRSRGEKSQGSSRTSKAEKEDERVKSKEIVKDVYSSDEEDENKNGSASVIDIMLNEHQSKLERDKIARMAKQAWERAMKKDTDGDSALDKTKEKKQSRKSYVRSEKKSSENHHNRKRKDHSLSPEPESRKKPKTGDVEQRKKPKIVRHAGNAAPPPPDFNAILAMAAQKLKDPPKPTGLMTIPKKKKKKEEDERPLTQEEKERKERVKSKEYQNWLKFGGKHPSGGKENSHSSSSSDEGDNRENNSKHSRDNDRSISSKNNFKDSKSNFKDSNRDTIKRPGHVGSSVKPKKEITVNENVLVCGPAEDDDEFNSDEDVVRGAKGRHQPQSASANPFDRIYNSVHKKKSANHNAAKKRSFQEEDEADEESDLDGFIDDGDDEDGDYSKHIAKIFGYNKNRYVDEDDDVSDMEANFATVMAEEKRSAKIGLMEDLEDIRREEEELKRKALLKKKMKRQ